MWRLRYLPTTGTVKCKYTSLLHSSTMKYYFSLVLGTAEGSMHLSSCPSPTEHIRQVQLLRDKSRWLKIIALWDELMIKLLIGLSWRRN